MRKLLFMMYFTKTRRERIVNSIIGLVTVCSFLLGIYMLWGQVSPWYFLPFVVAFMFDNLYYTDDNETNDELE